MDKRTEYVHNDTEKVAAEEYQEGQDPPNVRYPGNEDRKSVADHGYGRGGQSQREKAAVTKDIPQVGSYIVEAQYPGYYLSDHSRLVPALGCHEGQGSDGGKRLAREKRCATPYSQRRSPSKEKPYQKSPPPTLVGESTHHVSLPESIPKGDQYAEEDLDHSQAERNSQKGNGVIHGLDEDKAVL